ncbi:hypothetical protein ACHAWC_011811 [Mediolabrus comicus]
MAKFKTASCSCTACPNKGASAGENQKLFYCSVCQEDQYCSKACQKKAWIEEGHKYCCTKAYEFRGLVCPEDGIATLQETILGADPNAIIVLSEGSYHFLNADDAASAENTLVISKPIRLLGPTNGMESVTLHCNLIITDDDVSSSDAHLSSITVANVTIKGTVKVKSNSYKSVTFSRVRTIQEEENGDGVHVHVMRDGKFLFVGCELIGGEEALYIDGKDDLSGCGEENADKVHIKRTTIRKGAKRGICADDKFILEKSVIRDNGWYGIRSNLGWTDKGGNNWQRNPMKPNQTPTSGNGMFDGINIPFGGGGGGGGGSTINIGGRNIPINFSTTGDAAFPGFGQR